MRKFLLLCLLAPACFFSCKEADEQMAYASIYLPMATRANASGVFQATFNFTRDTTYIVGAYCAGSILTPHDVRVTLELATDSLARAQLALPAVAAYELLPQTAYSIDPASMECVIRKGTERGDIRVTFHTSLLDPAKKYILPLRISSVSDYQIAPKFNTLFFGVNKL